MIQRDQLSSRDRHRGRGRLHSSPAGGRGCIESKILCRRCRQQQPGEGTVRTLAERECAKGRIVLVQKGPQLILPPRPRMKNRREGEIPACLQRLQDSRSPGRSMFCIGTYVHRIHRDRPISWTWSSKKPRVLHSRVDKVSGMRLVQQAASQTLPAISSTPIKTAWRASSASGVFGPSTSNALFAQQKPPA